MTKWSAKDLIAWPKPGEPVKKAFFNEGENESEKLTFRLARSAFLGPWAVANPHWNANESFLERPIAPKELCDLLVLFGDDAILFSDKQSQLNPSIEPTLAWERWSRATIFGSIKQISGAVRRLNYSRKIYIDKNCVIPITWIEGIRSLSAVLVASRSNNLARNREADNFRLRIEYKRKVYEDRSKIGTSPGFLFVADTPTHIFDQTTLSELVEIFDTPRDFLSYLKWREKFFTQSRKDIFAESEMSITSLYLQREKTAAKLRKQSREKPAVPWRVPAVSFKQICAIPKIKDRAKKYSASYIWDELINRGYRAALSNRLVGNSMLPVSLEHFESNIRLLGQATRDERQYLANKMLTIRDNLTLDGGVYWQYSERGVIKALHHARICFLFLEAPPGEKAMRLSYSDYRDARAELSALCALNILKNHPDTAAVLLMAFEGPRMQVSTLGSSFDIINVAQQEWTSDELQKLDEANKKSGLKFGKHMSVEPSRLRYTVPSAR